MKRRILSLLVIVLLLSSARAEEADKQVDARKGALALAGAFSNDGFKIRDGHWAGDVKSGDRALVAVNLYAGNQYWFSVATDDKSAKIGVRLYDETGKPLPVEDYQGEATAAAGYSPAVSGQYFVSIAPTEGGTGTYCLVYSYK
ncbi:MAG: hypothetical protein M3Y69_03595 [Verrucomicrobiota bacterium]|nr:hypothetical protein [Verrucomicrobiota bacterium]